MFIKLFTVANEEPIYINSDYIVAVRDVSIFDNHYCMVDVAIPCPRPNSGRSIHFEGLVCYEVIGSASHVIDILCS